MAEASAYDGMTGLRKGNMPRDLACLPEDFDGVTTTVRL